MEIIKNNIEDLMIETGYEHKDRYPDDELSNKYFNYWMLFEEKNNEIQKLLGVSIDTKDLMPFGADETEGLSFKINGQLIEMGRTGMYETGDYIKISSLSFNKRTPASVIINYTTE